MDNRAQAIGSAAVRESPIDSAIGNLQLKQENIGERLAYLETRLAGVLTQVPKSDKDSSVEEVGKSHVHEQLLGANRRCDRHVEAIESMLSRLTA